MLNRVTGLFGWVEANDRRTLQLFLAFLVYFQILAMVTAFLPLTFIAPNFAPIYGWGNYFTFIAPVIMLLAAGLFAFKLFLHVGSVRRETGFRYVDSHEERRLCGIVEPLAIAAGIGTPYVGVIETPELNAFACGSRRKDSVIVVTRGLIDGLDDEQLAGVVAHEIAHIRNGDMRLMAVANICVATMTTFFARRQVDNRQIAIGLLSTLVLPILFVTILAIGLINQIGFWLVYATRLGISSSREFIADAEAIRLTQNPAAFVSALQTIDGRSAIPGVAIDQSAMMIDGDADGETASHPRIAERIAAIVRLTGSMALIAPRRRDTRNGDIRGFGRRATPVATADPAALEAAMAACAGPADRSLFTLFRRVAADSPNSVFGFPKVINYVLALWVALFIGFNHQAIANPASYAAYFDPRHAAALTKLVEGQNACADAERAAVWGMVTGDKADMSACDALITPGLIADEARAGSYHTGGGTFSNVPPEALQIAQVASERCFITGRYRPGGNRSDNRVLGLNERMTNVDFDSYMRTVSGSAFAAQIGEKGARDGQLHDYVERRTTMLQVIHLFYGDAGLATAQAAYAEADHAAVVAEIAERLPDPAYRTGLSPLDLAHHRLLAAEPAGFVPCVAKIGQAYLPPVADPNASVAQEMRDAGLSLPETSR
jgi:Zn-dependent protease with chaperone function